MKKVLLNIENLIKENKEYILKQENNTPIFIKSYLITKVNDNDNIVLKVKNKLNNKNILVKFPSAPTNLNILWEAKQINKLINSGLKIKGFVYPNNLKITMHNNGFITDWLPGESAYSILRKMKYLLHKKYTLKDISQKFKLFGRTLAIMHQNINCLKKSPYTIPITEQFEKIKKRIDRNYWFINRCEYFLSQIETRQDNMGWVHGNLRTDNIIFSNDGISIIDYERSGYGNQSQDVGRFLGFIVELRKIPLWPRIYFSESLMNFFCGYEEIRSLNYFSIIRYALAEIVYSFTRDCIIRKLTRKKILYFFNLKEIKNIVKIIENSIDYKNNTNQLFKI